MNVNDGMPECMCVFIFPAAYDWLMPESVGSASDYILELIQFLQTIFATFTNLPVSIPYIHTYIH